MMTREEITGALEDLGRMAQDANVTVDLAIYGGSAIALEWGFRTTTKDVDVVIQNSSAFFLDAARRIALARGWQENWINDAVKGFVSSQGDHRMFAEYMDATRQSGLRVFVPTAEYLLAMKCMAMRIDNADNNDVSDIKHLLVDLGLKTTDDVLKIVEKYYPQNKISPKTLYGVQEILQKLHEHEEGQPESSATKPG